MTTSEQNTSQQVSKQNPLPRRRRISENRGFELGRTVSIRRYLRRVRLRAPPPQTHQTEIVDFLAGIGGDPIFFFSIVKFM